MKDSKRQLFGVPINLKVFGMNVWLFSLTFCAGWGLGFVQGWLS